MQYKGNCEKQCNDKFRLRAFCMRSMFFLFNYFFVGTASDFISKTMYGIDCQGNKFFFYFIKSDFAGEEIDMNIF